MSQNAEHVLDHFELFRSPEYKEMLANKREQFEDPVAGHRGGANPRVDQDPGIPREELRREALTINPAKACQPLGAVFAAVGFERTLPFVHGSQGCVAYYRSHFSRHFKEPTSCVSSSMTEDAAVFGGQNNMVDGLANAYNLYKPKMIAVSTTCMAEVIGDDLNAFIKTAKRQGFGAAGFRCAVCPHPGLRGQPRHRLRQCDEGYRGTFLGWQSRHRAQTGARSQRKDQLHRRLRRIYYVGNLREVKRLLGLMGAELYHPRRTTATSGTPRPTASIRMYDGGTTKEEAAKGAFNASATISFQEFCTEKTLKYISSKGQETVAALNHPIGVDRQPTSS
jgi:nitrogenase molybdenum-iron protein beta chain